MMLRIALALGVFLLASPAFAGGESREALIDRLFVRDGAPYKTAYCIEIEGPIFAGDAFYIYAESHGNPRQRDQVELAWVTGVEVAPECYRVPSPVFPAPDAIGVADARGRDLEKNRKQAEARVGVFVAPEDYEYLVIRYVMRAMNKYSGGYFYLTQNKGKVGYLRFQKSRRW